MQGARLGWGRLTSENLLQALELHRVYADLMRRTPYLAHARGSNLLSVILASMEQAASGRPVTGAIGTTGTALMILSGHDTNQSNISGMLDLTWKLPFYPRDETPPGGAIVFSLWLDPRDGRRFVRLEYLAASLDQMHNRVSLAMEHPPMQQQILLPGCESGSGALGCSWDTFKAIVQRCLESRR